MSGEAPGGGACPVCRKPREHAYRPFCSKRCADIDLGRWLKGSYAIPAGHSGDDDEALHESDPARPPSNSGAQD